MNVSVYWNFHRKCWSIQHKGRVVDHSAFVLLENPTFRVSQTGRRRVLRQRRKNVHAKVSGRLLDHARGPSIRLKRVRYNPYRDASFVTEDGRRVDSADAALFLHDGTAWAEAPRAA